MGTQIGDPQHVAISILQDFPIPPNSTSFPLHPQGWSGHEDPNGVGARTPHPSSEMPAGYLCLLPPSRAECEAEVGTSFSRRELWLRRVGCGFSKGPGTLCLQPAVSMLVATTSGQVWPQGKTLLWQKPKHVPQRASSPSAVTR